MECEFRLGTSARPFCAGCSLAHLDCVAGALPTWPQWTERTRGWEQSQVFSFTLEGTTTRIESSYDTTNMQMKVVAQQKQRLAHYDFTMCGLPLRVCASREKTIPLQSLPHVAVPSHVRVRQRRSFAYTTKEGIDTWRVDCTRVWSGRTWTEAQRLSASNADPDCEIEVEYVGSRELVEEDVDYVAESGLRKMIALLMLMRGVRATEADHQAALDGACDVTS